MTFERTRNLRLVRLILGAVWERITDDGSPASEEFLLADSDALWHVLAFDGDELLGLWSFHARNSVCYEVHTCLLPGSGFHRGRQAARECARWVFQHMPCRRLVTSVPAYNRAAALFARAAGMTEYGRNSRSILRFGKLWDQTEYGLSPEDV